MKKVVFHSQFTAMATGMFLTMATGHNATAWWRVAGAGGTMVAIRVHGPCNRLCVVFIFSHFVSINHN